MSQSSDANEFGEGRRYSLSQSVAHHPVNPHCLASLGDAGKVAYNVHELAGTYRAAHLAKRGDVIGVRRGLNGKRALKKTMAVNLQPEHRPAKFNRLIERSADHVLNCPRATKALQALSDRRDQVGVFVAPDPLRQRMSPTRRTGPYKIEALKREHHRVGLMKLKVVMGLWRDINADNIEPGLMQAHASATLTTK